MKDKDFKFSEKQMEKLWTKYKSLIDKYITSDRNDVIHDMLDEIDERLLFSPASGRYRGNYPGGLIEHLIDVIYSSLYVRRYFEKMSIPEERLPSKESTVFVAAFHDLGKMGDEDKDYYKYQESEWHRKNLNEQYKHNEKMKYLFHADGSLYLLQHYDIKLSKDEFQAIRTHDGPYVPINRDFYDHGVELLTRILREGDMLAMVLRNRLTFTDEELRGN